MRCHQCQTQLDDDLDGRLDAAAAAAMQAHLASCAECTAERHQRQQMLLNLRALGAPPPPADFADRLFAQVRISARQTSSPPSLSRLRDAHRTTRRRRPAQWRLALVATLTLAALGLIVHQTTLPTTNPGVAPLPTVAGPSEPVRLVIRSPQDLDGVTIELDLPPGMRLVSQGAGSQQQTLRWETQLRAGANLLELPLLIDGPVGGELLSARFIHGDSQRQFLVRVQPSVPQAPAGTPLPASTSRDALSPAWEIGHV